MRKLISEKWVKARIPHRCLYCGVVAIKAGQQYRREVYVYDGRIYTWVSCKDCAAISSDVYEWYGCPDEGVSADEFDEWALQYRDENYDAESYLLRRWETTSTV